MTFYQNKLMLFLMLCLYITICQQSSISAESDSLQQVEKTQGLRQFYNQKSVTQKVISFPGKVIFFPFKLIFSGMHYGIVKVDETKIIPKTQDFLVSEDGRREVVPTYVSRIGAGIKYYQREIFNPESRLASFAILGLHQRQRYGIALERVTLSDLFYYSNYRALYEKLTDESFYGIGPDSRKEDEADYTREFFGADVSLGVDLFYRLSLRVYTGFHLNNILPGRESEETSLTDLYNAATLPGLETNVNLFMITLSFLSSSTNRPGNPSQGYEIEVGGSYYQQANDDNYNFFKTTADVRHYIHLFYDRVLVIRAAAELTDPLSGKSVPFYYLSELSEDISFRGFERGRFRDFDLILGSLEYRYPISNNFESILFSDAGQVSSDIFQNYNASNWEVTWGIGLRYVSMKGSVSKIELARSRDGFLLKLTLN
jgi:hypothetical protein